MPSGSVKLQSIKKLGQENRSYEITDEGKSNPVIKKGYQPALNQSVTRFSTFCRTGWLLHVRIMPDCVGFFFGMGHSLGTFCCCFKCNFI